MVRCNSIINKRRNHFNIFVKKMEKWSVIDNLTWSQLYDFLNWPSPASFSCLFSIFSKQKYKFYNKFMWKMSICLWCRDSNPKPLEHEPSPATTKPVLLLITLPMIFCSQNCCPRVIWVGFEPLPLHAWFASQLWTISFEL